MTGHKCVMQRIEAAVILFGDGRIDKDEYRRCVEQNERDIAHWEAPTTKTENAALELAMCMDAVEKLAKMWDIGDDEDRQGMARSLFSKRLQFGHAPHRRFLVVALGRSLFGIAFGLLRENSRWQKWFTIGIKP
jgi:hypothetical protein